MKREILFRGKRLDNHDWTYGDLTQDRDLGTAYISEWYYYAGETGIEREPFLYEVDPNTVGPFTGMTDKNGVKIFEGDILKDKNEISVVRWMPISASFVLDMFITEKEIGFENMDINLCKLMEIFGNEFDTPELLEVER